MGVKLCKIMFNIYISILSSNVYTSNMMLLQNGREFNYDKLL